MPDPDNEQEDQLPPRTVKLPRHRLTSFARWLYAHHPHSPPTPPPTHPVKIICISDTHTTQPVLPLGDLLLHAGDLSEIGSFDEIQTQLTWLSSQPHPHKVIIAGNHDLLFDSAFLTNHPERSYAENRGRSAADLVFGDVVYLQDSCVTLDFPGTGRKLKLYGAPWTPAYVASAFQHPREEDVWRGTVPGNADVLLSHGPPRGHLDGVLRAGSWGLAREVARVAPRLVVCGHIHVGYGREDIVYDEARKVYEGILGGWRDWGGLLWMAVLVGWGIMMRMLGLQRRLGKGPKATALVNAAVVGGSKNQLCNPPIVIEI